MEVGASHLQAEVDHLTGQHGGSGGAIASRVVGTASHLRDRAVEQQQSAKSLASANRPQAPFPPWPGTENRVKNNVSKTSQTPWNPGVSHSHLLDQLGASVLNGVRQLNGASNGHAVVDDLGHAELLLQHHVAACAAVNGVARVRVVTRFAGSMPAALALGMGA